MITSAEKDPQEYNNFNLLLHDDAMIIHEGLKNYTFPPIYIYIYIYIYPPSLLSVYFVYWMDTGSLIIPRQVLNIWKG